MAAQVVEAVRRRMGGSPSKVVDLDGRATGTGEACAEQRERCPFDNVVDLTRQLSDLRHEVQRLLTMSTAE
jgi:hypothetical protein